MFRDRRRNARAAPSAIGCKLNGRIPQKELNKLGGLLRRNRLLPTSEMHCKTQCLCIVQLHPLFQGWSCLSERRLPLGQQVPSWKTAPSPGLIARLCQRKSEKKFLPTTLSDGSIPMTRTAPNARVESVHIHSQRAAPTDRRIKKRL